MSTVPGPPEATLSRSVSSGDAVKKRTKRRTDAVNDKKKVKTATSGRNKTDAVNSKNKALQLVKTAISAKKKVEGDKAQKIPETLIKPAKNKNGKGTSKVVPEKASFQKEAKAAKIYGAAKICGG